jgi:hypothetical protein
VRDKALCKRSCGVRDGDDFGRAIDWTACSVRCDSATIRLPIEEDIVTGDETPAAQRIGEMPFQAHVELLQLFVEHRDEIVERIEGLLNAQRKPIEFLRDVPLLSRQLEDCFFTLPEVTHSQSGLRRQLEEAHWASGFKPRETPGEHNDLIDPAEMMSRAFHMWQRTRWPGRQGRVRCAHILFNLYLIRRLMLLSMRLWDGGAPGAGDRLSQVQGMLDQLWGTTPADQPVFVRNARWLFPLAQSPTTDELAGYFEVAQRIAETLSDADRIEIHKASVRMAGGHLRSQLRHVATLEGLSFDDDRLVLSTRRSNALDLATLIQGLVPLLEAYERATQSSSPQTRLELAAAICEGISPDPELFLNRLDLLGPYSMIEHLFVTTDDDGRVVYTPTGQRHVRLLEEYAARLGRVLQPLHEDCPRFRPVDGAYSPYGVLYGFSSRLLEHMALKALTPDAVTHFSLEDVFAEGDADKLAWVSGWRKLPHIPRDVAKLFEYPQQFAENIFDRIEHALRRSVADGDANVAARTGRLFIGLADGPPSSDLSVEYFLSSDRQIVEADQAVFFDQTQLLHSRVEGEFVVSYKTSGGWLAITKDFLTEVLGAGRDAKIAGLPRVAAGVLSLMCPGLVVLAETAPH